MPELDDINTAPPALFIMLREFASGRDWQDVRRRIRAALRDMKEQSLVFESQNVSRAEPPDARLFEVHPHGALDLLTEHGCVNLDCRIAAAEKLARSFGLIADRVWLTDHLSTEVMTLGRATNDALDRLMHHAVALAPLLPLMKAGIIRFRSPWISTCADCSDEFERQVEIASQEVLRAFRSQVKVEPGAAGGFCVKTGNFFEPPLVIQSYTRDTSEIPSSRDYAKYLVHREVRQILWASREATYTRGAVFSSSRVALAGMLQCEGRLPPSRAQLRIFEENRALNVPWVSELNPSQVLQLREEASDAIPLFREMLARAVTYSGEPLKESAASDAIATLREQAMEVRAELSVKQKKSARYWKVAYGVLGLGLSAYGVGTDQILPGVGGLLPILQLLISHKIGHESDIAKLKSRPGYVLVRAQDILAHAH